MEALFASELEANSRRIRLMRHERAELEVAEQRGSNPTTGFVVEDRGFEPLTSSMPCGTGLCLGSKDRTDSVAVRFIGWESLVDRANR
jgi:hypothetical protein